MAISQHKTLLRKILRHEMVANLMRGLTAVFAISTTSSAICCSAVMQLPHSELRSSPRV